MIKHLNTRAGRRVLTILLLSSLVVAFTAWPIPLSTPPAESVRAINQTELRMHLEFLASDELGGRYTLSPGLQIAARYLASRLASYGFRGAAPGGSFMQPIKLFQTKPVAARTVLSVQSRTETLNYEYGDFITNSTVSGSASGPLVFVGYGISSASQQHDDYRGLDVRNKIVVIVPGAPKSVDSSKLGETEQDEGAARAHGAVGAIFLPAAYRAADMRKPDFKERARLRERVRLAVDRRPQLPSITITPAVADRLLTQLGMTLEQIHQSAKDGQALAPRALDSSASFSSTIEEKETATQNVAAILEGSDPVLKNEYVAISAHYDHLKTGAHGEIYHGADDDGSGTAAVLNIARAFSLQRPKRSVLVIFHTAEELGLLGSKYNADYSPVVPLEQIVVDLNIDMIGRSRLPGDTDPQNKELSDANTIYLIGADRISRELHQISEQTNADFEKLQIDYRYNNPNHPQRFYYRSDHWNYAKHDIPIIFYFDGVHADYHEPSDTVDKIDFDKMTRVARLVFETGWRIANLDHRPQKG